MKYFLKGKLFGYLSPTFKVPITKANVRLYRFEDDRQPSEIKPKHAFTILSEKKIDRDNKFLVTETMTDQKGNFSVELGEAQNYDGGPLRIDLCLTEVPGQQTEKKASKPVQVTIAIEKPRWRKTKGCYESDLRHRLHWRQMESILDWMSWRLIFGRVRDRGTNSPVSGAIVHAFDTDQRSEDDKLGQGITNEDGYFFISYSKSDFIDTFPMEDTLFHFDAGPDIYFRVETSGGILLLEEPSSEGRRPDRMNAGPLFYETLYVGETGKLYVASGDSGSVVTIVDIGSNNVLDTIAVGGSPSEVAITPDGSFAYVSNYSLNTVAVIDTATRTLVTTVPVGAHSNSIAMAPDGAHCYVGLAFADYCVSVIDTATNTVSANIPFPEFADADWAISKQVVVTPNGSRVFVANGDNILSIDTATNTVVAYYLYFGEDNFEGLEVSSDNARLYVAIIPDYPMLVLDTETLDIIGEFDLDEINSFAITPDGTRIYAGIYAYTIEAPVIRVLDVATGAVIADIEIDHNAGDIEITSGGTRAYCCNRYGGQLSVIDTASNTVIATIPGVQGNITIAP